MYESKQLSMSCCNRFEYLNKFPSSLSGINKFSFLIKGKVVWEIKHLHVSKDKKKTSLSGVGFEPTLTYVDQDTLVP